MTANPFGLAAPPSWFLTALCAYDSEIVIFPSVQEPVYRMGRRGRNGYGLLRVLKRFADTPIYVAHKLWPLQSILPAAVGLDWNRVLLELPEYDTHRFKDPNAQLEQAEAKQDAAVDRAIQNDLDARASDSYRLMRFLDGSKVGAGKRPEGAGYKKLPYQYTQSRRRAVYRPQGSGAGAMFVGR